MQDTLEVNNSRSQESAQLSNARTLSQLKAELPYVLVITLITIATYACVLINKQSLSRICRLAEWDSVFQNYATGKAEAFDPSLVQLLIPNYFLSAGFWHKWELPLWNSYSASGVPLLADIQATVFSPLHILLNIWPSMQAYNITLVFELWLAATGTYLFARLLGLRPLYSLLSAALYTYCPYNLYYLELLSGTSAALLPLLLASFLTSARNFTRKTLALSGIASAAYVLSGHPESSLYGIATASALFLFWPHPPKALAKRFLELTGIGSLALTLTAPVLLPFLEYLKAGESYKYAGDISAFAPWQGLFLNLLSPCLKAASPYLGFLTIPALLALILLPSTNGTKSGDNHPDRKVLILIALNALVSLIFIARIGPVHELLRLGPLTYLITVYLIPSFLFCLIALLTTGLSKLADSFSLQAQEKSHQTAFALLATGSLLPLGGAYLLAINNADLNIYNFDSTLCKLALSKHNLLTQTILSAVYLLPVALLTFTRPQMAWLRRYRSQLFSLLTLSFTIGSLFLFNHQSLPAQNKFCFPEPEIISFLKSHKGKVLPMAEHILKANANTLYGISSFRIHNPLLPARFAHYATAAGASIDEFRNQHYDASNFIPNKFLDAAGVKYLLTQFKDLPAPFKLIFTSKEGIRVYENPRALPEAYASAQVQLKTDPAKSLIDMKADIFSPQEQTIVEKNTNQEWPHELKVLAQSPSNQQPVKALPLSQIKNNHFHLNTAEKEPSFLTLTQTYYPGWKASIDGQEVPLYRANYLFQGLVLPAGQHSIDLVYTPTNFPLALLAAFLGLLTAGILLFAREKKPS
jgi:hypothetical protein